MTGDRPDDLLELAVDIAREAGALVFAGSRQATGAVDTKSSATDVVTATDRSVEEAIVTRLRDERPGDRILGEEGGEQGEEGDERAGGGVRWLVDPIDGTVNFLYRLPQYAVSIAAEVGGDVVAGVVLDVAKDELFTATKGGGARLDGELIHCSDRTELAQALVATGFSYSAERRGRQARVLVDLLPVVRDIRRLGAASLDLCAVACGRVDAYYEKALSPWDVAAGALIATEAGARVSDLGERSSHGDFMVASAPGVFDEFSSLLTRLRAAEA